MGSIRDLSDAVGQLLSPHLRSVRIDDVIATDRLIRLDAATCGPSVACTVGTTCSAPTTPARTAGPLA
jgi:hypothetical protein